MASDGGFDKNAYQREYMAKQAAKARDIEVRKCAEPNRRRDLLADPVEFLKWYFPDRFFRPFSQDQRETIEHIVESVRLGTDEIFCAPRGDWKTETTKGMAIYLILSQLLKFPVLIGATADDAHMKFEDIKAQFERNDRLADDFPEVCDPIRSLENSPQKARRQTFAGKPTRFDWRAKYCTFPDLAEVPGTGEPSPFAKCAFTYRGLDGQIRGINIGGRRPDLALCDDLETRESADSDHQIGIRERLLDKDVAGLAGGGERLPRIVIGTVQNRKCLTYKKLIEWGGRQYKAVDQWPGDRGMELADEYVEIRKAEKQSGSKTFDKSRSFYLENRGLIEEGVKVSNPYCHSSKTYADGSAVEVSTFQRVLNNAADNGWEYVHCELQNDPPEDNDVETLGLTWQKVASRISGYDQRQVPKEADVVVASIDLGKYACHWSIGAWREGLIGNIVNYGVAEVHGTGVGMDKTQSQMAIRSALLQWRQELLGGDLCDRAPDIILIDSSDFTEMVYAFVKEVAGSIPTFYATKGLSPYRTYRSQHGKLIAGNHWHASLQEKDGVWLYLLDTDNLKGMVHQMWATPTFDEAQSFSPMSLSLFSARLPSGQPDVRRHTSFAKHQTAEEYREEFQPGRGMKRGWYQLNPNNHWLDAVYMQVAGAIMKGIDPPFAPRPMAPAKPKSPRNFAEKKPNRFQRDRSFIARRT